MDNHQKRNLTFLTIGLLFVLSGIEYGKWTFRSSTGVGAGGDDLLVGGDSARPTNGPGLWLSAFVPPAVILPTIWRYLQILEAPPYFLGLGLSAFSLSGLLTGPLFGFWSDRSGTTKSIVLFSNLFEIAGELSDHGHMTTAKVRQDVMLDLVSLSKYPGADHVTETGSDLPNCIGVD